MYLNCGCFTECFIVDYLWKAGATLPVLLFVTVRFTANETTFPFVIKLVVVHHAKGGRAYRQPFTESSKNERVVWYTKFECCVSAVNDT
jgi:hypothetical protein